MLTQKRLKEVLSYDKNTGVFTCINKTRGPVKKGGIVGFVKARGSRKKREQVGERSDISAYPLAPDNGQVMTRNPRCVGQDWEHV